MAIKMANKKFAYVFWRYDRYPGVIWARITGGPYRDGSVGVDSYGAGAKIEKSSQVKILSEKKGEEVIDALNLLIAERTEKQRQLSEEYMKAAIKVAPFLRKKKGTTNGK